MELGDVKGRDTPVGSSLSRRTFLAASGAVLAAGLVGCGDSRTSFSPPARSPDMTKAFLLSGRGRSVSNAATMHNHNKVFVSQAAADSGRAHPGDNSRIVRIDVSVAQWRQWFGSGRTVVDLRNL